MGNAFNKGMFNLGWTPNSNLLLNAVRPLADADKSEYCSNMNIKDKIL